MKLDVLVLAAHPDDAELGCSGTVIKLVQQGRKVGIVDFTRGELGTRGTPQLRLQEADAAAKIMGLSIRENLGLADGFFQVDEESKRAVIAAIRRYQPTLVLANAPEDRHPDHGRAGALAREACFLAGLRKIETQHAGATQAAWRPAKVLHYIQDRLLKPTLVVDITDQWPSKIEAIKAFSSQFFNPRTTEPETYISRNSFVSFLEGRARDMGHMIGAEFGEGFISIEPLKIDDPLLLAPGIA